MLFDLLGGGDVDMFLYPNFMFFSAFKNPLNILGKISLHKKTKIVRFISSRDEGWDMTPDPFFVISYYCLHFKTPGIFFRTKFQ